MRNCSVILLSLLIFPALSWAGSNSNAELIGATGPSYRVLVRAIDDGDVLWSGGYTLGNKASVSPGKHTISLMCETTTSYGTNLGPGTITMNFEPGQTYDLDVADGDSQACKIEAKVRT